MEIFHVEDLSFKYPNKSNKALDGISLNIKQGEFLVVFGESGCGKTTLLRLLKRELAPSGEKKGKIFYNAIEQSMLDDYTSACEIGFVFQNSEQQIVSDTVKGELAFGAENMGLPSHEIRRKVAEMAGFFGIEEIFNKSISELSGGQKQMVSLASILTMSPKVLILDEPTSQLDPIAASEFISALYKLNREFGITIILVEHRLEEVFPIADRVIFMDNGKVVFSGKPQAVGASLRGQKMAVGLPSAMRIFQGLNVDGNCPLTVRDGQRFLSKIFDKCEDSVLPTSHSLEKKPIVELKNIWFRYEKNTPDILRGVDLNVFENEILCVLGGNGTGKTTALNVISGISKAYTGKILIQGKNINKYKNNSIYKNCIAYLPQNPLTVFIKSTIREDLEEICDVMGYNIGERKIIINSIAHKLNIVHLLETHPYDLSGGEQQKCALAKVLLQEPKILLLDEPTKGIDAYSKSLFSQMLKSLANEGLTIIIVTHDIEFAAENADRCALFFDGEIVSCDIPSVFFSNNYFYTTAANRIARHIFKYAITCDDVIKNFS
ncbi:MAG TPA: energy-coupling factor transporter ATPase [Clostridia bacterium]|nr:energy-coupling factor transporter ATPase [Clostridia bacterium]